MNKELNKQMADSIKNFRLPRYSELPDIGLYLEQTTKYINSFLSPLGCMEITTSMISNYVKKGVISSPTKKLYYAEQIAHLFFIAIAKNILSIENISILISMQRKTYSYEVAYDYFCSELENMLFFIFGLKDTVDQIGVTNTDEKTMLRSVIVAATNIIHLNKCLEIKENHGK